MKRKERTITTEYVYEEIDFKPLARILADVFMAAGRDGKLAAEMLKKHPNDAGADRQAVNNH
jgi:hypothetical protein